LTRGPHSEAKHRNVGTCALVATEESAPPKAQVHETAYCSIPSKIFAKKEDSHGYIGVSCNDFFGPFEKPAFDPARDSSPQPRTASGDLDIKRSPKTYLNPPCAGFIRHALTSVSSVVQGVAAVFGFASLSPVPYFP